MKIITGYQGEAHITSNEIQGENQGVFGTGSYVMDVGNKFTPTLISANELQIASGEGVLQGVHFRVDPGTYDSVTIENGTQGMNRKDLVVCRYTKDGGTGVESCEWVVIKGTASSGTATRPSHTTGDILGGSLSVDMPFFEVALSGINVSAVTSLFTTVKGMATMQSEINTLNTKYIIETYSVTIEENTITTQSNTEVAVSYSKSGYTPRMFSVRFGNSSRINFNIEGFGATKIYGYARAITATITTTTTFVFYVLWEKN